MGWRENTDNYKECNLNIGIDGSSGMEDGQQEIANFLYMSALEIVADIEQVDTKRCEKCGQMVYSIFSKVKKLVEHYSDRDFVKNIISPYYNKRSKFLHQGEVLIKKYIGTSIPMLNEDGEPALVYNIALINVREYTGYLLRKGLQEYFHK